MYANYNELDMYCYLTDNHKGRYEINARIAGWEIRVFTNDAEIYDYFDEDYYDDDEEFVDACERLDLDPEANDVKRVLYYPPTISAPGMLICMSEDWEIA